MAYSELIKNFTKIREYVRQFYVYGFRSRNAYHYKSARSYDNEHRRMESWLGEYMRFRQESSGKIVFLSLDSRNCPSNPLYVALKAKSFTDNDIAFHFYVMDALSDGNEMTLKELLEWFDSEYLSNFPESMAFDESNVRKKLKEYTGLGLIRVRKEAKQIYYSRNESEVDTHPWLEAISFFSETDPMGVVGSYLLDRHHNPAQPFRFRHHYIFQALDSEIVYAILNAIGENRWVRVVLNFRGSGYLGSSEIFPVRICVSTQTGRQYLLGYHKELGRMVMTRIDHINQILPGDIESDQAVYQAAYEEFRKHQWGASLSQTQQTERVEMTIQVGEKEGFIVSRLHREKRCGQVQCLDNSHYRFTAEVYDALELLPWIRTFTGRITRLECSNPELIRRFQEGVAQLEQMYGGESL